MRSPVKSGNRTYSMQLRHASADDIVGDLGNTSPTVGTWPEWQIVETKGDESRRFRVFKEAQDADDMMDILAVNAEAQEECGEFSDEFLNAEENCRRVERWADIKRRAMDIYEKTPNDVNIRATTAYGLTSQRFAVRAEALWRTCITDTSGWSEQVRSLADALAAFHAEYPDPAWPVAQ